MSRKGRGISLTLKMTERGTRFYLFWALLLCGQSILQLTVYYLTVLLSYSLSSIPSIKRHVDFYNFHFVVTTTNEERLYNTNFGWPNFAMLVNARSLDIFMYYQFVDWWVGNICNLWH